MIQHKGGSFRYGRIVCFVHPDGLYSTSHEEGYNGKDLLECVEIEKSQGSCKKWMQMANLKVSSSGGAL